MADDMPSCRAAALRLAQEGAQLALIGRRREPLTTLAKEIHAAGGQAMAIACDVSDNEAMATLGAQIAERFGRLDGVFANAGVLGDIKPLRSIPASS